MRYNYVPKCPRCGSEKTGMYITLNGKYDYYRVVSDYMKKGELIRIRSSIDSIDSPDLFCDKCKAEWYGSSVIKHITREELIKEKEKRGITTEGIYDNRYKTDNAKVQYKKEKKNERTQKIKNAIKNIIRH